MGIDKSTLQFLLSSKKSGVSFDHIITLGRQDVLILPSYLKSILGQYGIGNSDTEIDEILRSNDYFADNLFKKLGAKQIDSIDQSRFEGATIIHDMNKRIPDELKRKYSLVIDGGTLEHVFNFPQAIKNCMEMVRVGGHFISITPCNNLMGHGFYQFSPELYFRVFNEKNGFLVEAMFIKDAWGSGSWFKVNDPDQIHKRVECVTTEATNLFLRAKRNKEVEIFSSPPYQSDYSNIWSEDSRERNIGRLDFFYKQRASRRRFSSHILDLLPNRLAKEIQSYRRFKMISTGKDPDMFIKAELD